MNDQALHGIAIYNPDLLSRDELKKYFVARKPILERLLNDLRREKNSGTPQHRLIIGARGMGKSTLLRRFSYAVEDDATLSKHWLPLCFPEEQYNITRLSDLWLNCLDALSDTLEQQGFTKQAHELDDLLTALPIEEEARARQALNLLKEQARKLSKRLILLIDNLDIVLTRLKAAHWTIREVMSEKGGMILIGSSAHAIEATYEYEAAFYDFFKIDELKGLSEDEMRNVLFNLADISDNEGVKTILKKDNARIKTLHTLTGGNPRTTVLLYGVISQGLDGDVRSDLEKLLDHCTPLYKARFEELSVQNQQVVDALAVHWDPIRAGDLARLLRLQVNAVSSQLNRLVQQGIVEKVKYPGKKTGFQIAERFFNIWYLMRASRRVRRRLIWLVHFLRMFYNSEELALHARSHLMRIMPQDSSRRLRYAEYGFALAQSLENQSLCRALESTSIHTMIEDSNLREKFAKLIDLDGEDAPLKPKVERIRMLEKTREILQDNDITWGGIEKNDFINYFLGTPALNPEVKYSFAHTIKKLGAKDLADFNQRLNAAYKSTTKVMLSEQLARDLYKAIAEGEMLSLEDTSGAKTAAERYQNPIFPIVASLFIAEKNPLEKNTRLLQKTLSDAQGISDDMKPFLAKTWLILAAIIGLNRPEKAKEAFSQCLEKADDLEPNNAEVLIFLAISAVSIGNWRIAANHLEVYLKDFHVPDWDIFLLFVRSSIENGFAKELLKLFRKHKTDESLRPLAEAIKAIESGSDEYLLTVAPEVRKPALEIYNSLSTDLSENND